MNGICVFFCNQKSKEGAMKSKIFFFALILAWVLCFYGCKKYDSTDNKIHEKTSGGYGVWCEYDSADHMTHEKNSDGNEIWYDDGRITHVKKSDGDEYWYEYGSAGNMTHEKRSDGGEFWYSNAGHVYEYDSKNPNHSKDLVDGSDWYFKRNAKINIPDIVDDDDYRPTGWKWKEENLGDRWCKYDEKGRAISFGPAVNSQNYEDHYLRCLAESDVYLEYDSNGRTHNIRFYYYLGACDIRIYNYDYYNNGKLKNFYIEEGLPATDCVSYRNVIFDIHGNAVYWSHEFGDYFDTFAREYKDGKIVKSMAMESDYGFRSTGEIDSEMILNGTCKLCGMDSLGNLKINEDTLKDKYEWRAIDSMDWPNKSVKEAYDIVGWKIYYY
jgi:YD repeat-containing protein